MVLTIVTATTTLARTAAADGTEGVASGVVHLFVLGEKGSGTGSGFLINERGAIVTNHHVVTLQGSEPNARIFVMSDARARELAPTLRSASITMAQAYERVIVGLPSAKVAWADESKDLAVVMPDVPMSGGVLPLAPGNLVRENDRVVAFGFPGLNLRMGPEALVTLDRRPGEITSRHVEQRSGRAVYSTSAVTYKGMSGGPAVNACGEVIGVVVGAYTRKVMGRNDSGQEDVAGYEGVTVFIQTDTLVKELDARSITYRRASERCAPTLSSSSTTIALPVASRDPLLAGGVIAAIVLGLVAVALGATKRGRTAVKAATDSVSRRLSRRDEKRGQPPARDAHEKEVAGSDRDGKAGRDRGRTPPSTDGRGDGRGGAAASNVPLLYGLSGEYDGVELELGREPVAIGRDPRLVHLVFSSDTSVVSGRHCAVWFDPDHKAVMLEDLWSTNGTYLADGRRLPGGVPQRLRSADQFYLGDPEVLFEVRY